MILLITRNCIAHTWLKLWNYELQISGLDSARVRKRRVVRQKSLQIQLVVVALQIRDEYPFSSTYFFYILKLYTCPIAYVCIMNELLYYEIKKKN